MNTDALAYTLQTLFTSLFGGPPPDPDTQRAMRAAQHNNQKVMRA